VWVLAIASRRVFFLKSYPGNKLGQHQEDTLFHICWGHYNQALANLDPLAQSDQFGLSANGKIPLFYDAPLVKPQFGPTPPLSGEKDKHK
jgi:hypothetical protein